MYVWHRENYHIRLYRVTTLQTMWNSLTVCDTPPRHVKCYSYHACTTVTVSGGGRNATVHDLKLKYLTHSRLLLNTCMHANMQLTVNSFRQLFPDKIFSLTSPWLLVKSLTFPWQLSNSLTFPGFPDLVTLYIDTYQPISLCHQVTTSLFARNSYGSWHVYEKKKITSPAPQKAGHNNHQINTIIKQQTALRECNHHQGV